jgi:hypothetical protein
MKTLLWILSAVALLLTIVPPAMVAAGSMEAPLMKTLMLAATVFWFIVWPMAIRSRSAE